MNIKNENATPLERISDEMFRAEYGVYPPSEEGHVESEEIIPPFALDSCLCKNAPLAMVYAPRQRFRELYAPEEALMAGTLFKELDYPFYPGGERRGVCFD